MLQIEESLVPSYSFGARSLRELRGIRPELIAVAFLALRLSPVDFGCYDGLRTPREQALLLAQGRSWSEKSYHLTGDAMDLVPWEHGAFTWDWQEIFPMVGAVALAARALGVGLVWGGVWDKPLAELDGSDLQAEVDAYVARRRSRGLDAHPDGAHFQTLDRSPHDPAIFELAA